MAYNKQTIGNVEIMVLHDAAVARLLSMAFPGVPAEAWAPYQQRFPEAYIGTENLRVHFECYLIRSQGRTLAECTLVKPASARAARASASATPGMAV